MPPAIIAAAIAAAATVGTTAYQAHNSGIDERAAADQAKKAEQAAANQANLTKQEAVLGQQGQTQAQTGGSLTDSGTAALTDLLAGYPGYQAGRAGAVSGGGVGVGAGGGGTGTGGATDTGLGTGGGSGSSSDLVSTLLAALRNNGSGAGTGTGFGTGFGTAGSNISGGNWQLQPAQPQSGQELANPVLG